jgi:hypothetical protein
MEKEERWKLGTQLNGSSMKLMAIDSFYCIGTEDIFNPELYPSYPDITLRNRTTSVWSDEPIRFPWDWGWEMTMEVILISIYSLTTSTDSEAMWLELINCEGFLKVARIALEVSGHTISPTIRNSNHKTGTIFLTSPWWQIYLYLMRQMYTKAKKGQRGEILRIKSESMNPATPFLS